MQAGLLNSRVTIMQPRADEDENGAVVNQWVEFCKLWADVRNKSGLESIKADAITGVVRASIRVRYNRNLTNTMRVIVRDMTYDIKAVLHDEQGHDYTDLICEALS